MQIRRQHCPRAFARTWWDDGMFQRGLELGISLISGLPRLAPVETSEAFMGLEQYPANPSAKSGRRYAQFFCNGRDEDYGGVALQENLITRRPKSFFARVHPPLKLACN